MVIWLRFDFLVMRNSVDVFLVICLWICLSWFLLMLMFFIECCYVPMLVFARLFRIGMKNSVPSSMF